MAKNLLIAFLITALYFASLLAVAYREIAFNARPVPIPLFVEQVAVVQDLDEAVYDPATGKLIHSRKQHVEQQQSKPANPPTEYHMQHKSIAGLIDSAD